MKRDALAPYVSFDAWTSQQQADEDFNAQTVEVYRSIWGVWLAWLAERDMKWPEAGERHIRDFLGGPAQAARGRGAIDDAKMANFTRQRYWRVLRGTYAQACRDGHVDRNPALDVAEQHRPHIERRSRQSQILPVGVLDTLRNSAAVEQLIPQSSPTQWWVLRDRAGMALLAHAGVTTAELIALRGRDLRQGTAALTAEPPPPALAGTATSAPDVHVDVFSGGADVQRNVPLPGAALPPIRAWLRAREKLLRQRYASLPGAPRLADSPLFVSRQRGGDGLLPAMEPSTVYMMVKRCLAAAYEADALSGAAKAGARVAQGASIIRNTVLRDWIDTPGIGADEAARRGGLKSAASLRLPQNGETPGA